jgi:primosomal protein N' (replication factor Y)
MADPGHPAVQALVRWDPATFADRELAERAALHLPPAAVLATVSGAPDAVAALLAGAAVPPPTEVLGPVEAGDGEHRVVLRCPRADRRALVGALRSAAGVRSAHKDSGPVRIQVDPQEVG